VLSPVPKSEGPGAPSSGLGQVTRTGATRHQDHRFPGPTNETGATRLQSKYRNAEPEYSTSLVVFQNLNHFIVSEVLGPIFGDFTKLIHNFWISAELQ